MKTSPGILQRSVEDLKINRRSLNCLKAENIVTVRDLVQRTEVELLRTPNLGMGTLNDIKAALELHGLTLQPRTRPAQLTEEFRTRSFGPLARPICLLYCSFCGKSQHEVRKLIAGPSVFVCDECVELCSEVIHEERAHTFPGAAQPPQEAAP